MVMGQSQQMWVHTIVYLLFVILRCHWSHDLEMERIFFGVIQESNDMIDALDEASSDEEFDEEDLAEVRKG